MTKTELQIALAEATQTNKKTAGVSRPSFGLHSNGVVYVVKYMRLVRQRLNATRNHVQTFSRR
jgi:hypothetical protein